MTYKLIGNISTKKFSKVNKQNLGEMLNQKETLGFMEYQNTSTKLVIRLDEEIKDVNYYADIIERMSNLTEQDEVHLVINSVGGTADGAMAIISAIENTDAVVVGIVEGKCHSAASIILMHCDGAAIGKYAHSLCHVWSNFDGGKAPDFDSSYNFNRKFLRDFIEDSYKYFMTDEEIQQMLDGKDWWFDADSLAERIQRRYEMLQQEQEEIHDDDSGKECCEGCSCSGGEDYDKEFYGDEFCGDDPRNKLSYKLLDETFNESK